MKRIITMLLIACSAIITVSAEPADNAQQKGKQDNVPYQVKALFRTISQTWGSPNEVYSVNKNPETNQIESSVRITTFSADNDKFPHMAGKTYLNTSTISKSFKDDESKSYQILHLSPGDNKKFSLKAVNESGESETYNIRNNNEEEMWLMCCKNPQNPKLRDVYAIKWVITKEGTKVNGVIYQITSLRPDVYEKNFESNKRMFKIVGRVGDEIKDSLYNIYIADSREALYNLQDYEYVACIPVVNKRFEWQTELTKPCVGRLRCIFPDGSLCSAWIDLDFVPGETYNITVHNGYYDEDKDYERRVGRQSGKSLIEPDAVKVVDEVPAEYQKANPVEDDFQKWYKSLSPTEEVQFQIKAERIEMSSQKLDELYRFIKMILDGSNVDYKMDITFNEILKQNKEIEAKWQEFFKLFKDKNLPKTAYPKVYKEIIEIYTGQLRELNNYYKKHGAMSKAARQVYTYVIKQNEKYMDAMEKVFE
jgi:hypothetical protein